MNDNADNLVYLDIVTRHNIPPERVLKCALEADVKDIVICGYTKDGEEYFASSLADGGSVLWLLERMKKMLLEVGDD